MVSRVGILMPDTKLFLNVLNPNWTKFHVAELFCEIRR